MATADSKIPDSRAKVGEVTGIDAPSAVIGAAAIPGGGWLQLGMSLLGGLGGGSKLTQSGAGGASAGSLNTSGWTVGNGDATGGDLKSTSSAASAPFSVASIPWYGWVAGALVAIAIIKGGR